MTTPFPYTSTTAAHWQPALGTSGEVVEGLNMDVSGFTQARVFGLALLDYDRPLLADSVEKVGSSRLSAY